MITRSTDWPHPVVIIFGAGATRGALEDISSPPPVDNDFFDIAGQLKGHGTPPIAKDVLRSVWELYRKTNGVSLEGYYRDIETREIIGQFAKSANQPKDWKNRKRKLEELIRRVYIQTTCEDSESGLRARASTIHKSVLEQLKSGDALITFNYDLLIEESFATADIWNPVDGYGVTAGGKTHDWCKQWLRKRLAPDFPEDELQSKILLLKLHGSLNWNLYNNKFIRLKPRPYVVRAKKTEKISILAPGWKKPIDRNPYKQFWREARLRLEKCKTLIILGYSLPDTDLLAHALFSEVVRLREARKNFIKELHIADPNPIVRDRFIELFTPALGPIGKLFKYQDIKEFSRRLSVEGPYKEYGA